MAVFEGLSEKLQGVLKRVRGSVRVTEADVKEMMREVRLALIEADVNYKVVRDFVARISEQAAGSQVMESLTPGQQIIKIVHEALVDLLGTTWSKPLISSNPPTIYMLAGLQGSGKTTSAGKLASFMRKQGKKPLLVACDVYRPAAVQQLIVVGNQLSIPVFSLDESRDPVHIARESIEFAKSRLYDLVILDTAGRLHVDMELMDELKRIKAAVRPTEILLVVDAMTGQDAVNAAGSFHEQLGIDGIIITKLDSDTRGGAALTVKAVTGCPVKFAGIGEKLDELEPFHPERMASRILGMGDVLSLIEKAQESLDEKKAADLERKLKTDRFTLVDYLEQMQQLKKMGPLNKILGMLPGINIKQLENAGIDEKKMARTEAIILSMTQKERLDPALLNFSRKKRVAAGSGTSVQDINILLKGYEDMRKLFKQMNQGSRRGPLAGGGRNPFGGFRF